MEFYLSIETFCNDSGKIRSAMQIARKSVARKDSIVNEYKSLHWEAKLKIQRI